MQAIVSLIVTAILNWLKDQAIKHWNKAKKLKRIKKVQENSVKTGETIESEKLISSNAGGPSEFSNGVLTLSKEDAEAFEGGRMDSKGNDSGAGSDG